MPPEDHSIRQLERRGAQPAPAQSCILPDHWLFGRTQAPDGAGRACAQIEAQLKRHRTDFVTEIRARARVDFEAQSSFPALLLNYHANPNEITGA